MGRRNYAALMEHSLALGRSFAKLISESENFELTSEVTSNIVTWRFVPANWKNKLQATRDSVNGQKNQHVRDSALQQITAMLNETTVEIQKIQRQRGQSFVSRTTLESVMIGFDTVVFRAVLFHPLTSAQTLSEVLAEQKNIGESVLARVWPKFESQLADWEKPLSQATEN
jgi:glutamate decarboxylase